MPVPGAGEGAGGGLSPEQQMMMMRPSEFWLTASLFDEMLAPYAGNVDTIIVTTALPMDAQHMKLWTLEPPPKVVLIGGAGGSFDLKKALQTKAVVAVVHYNPRALYDAKPPPPDLDEAFAKRYLLITPENVEQMAAEFPEIFPPVASPPAN